jgi:hypothetical protein
LATTLYQGNHDKNHKFWSTIPTRIYIPYADATGMLLHIIGKIHNGNIEILYYVVISILTGPQSISNCRSRYEADIAVSVMSLFKKNSRILMMSVSENL